MTGHEGPSIPNKDYLRLPHYMQDLAADRARIHATYLLFVVVADKKAICTCGVFVELVYFSKPTLIPVPDNNA